MKVPVLVAAKYTIPRVQAGAKFGEAPMKKILLASAILALVGASNQAQAIGCLTGGAAGAVAGHYAGHHAVLGALGGCVAGHHLHKKQVAAAKLKKQQEMQQPAATPQQPATTQPAQ